MTEEEKQEEQATIDSLWSQVDYTFADYAQFTSSETEIRILFGDRVPPRGKVKPLFGLILSPIHAHAVLETFKKTMDAWKEGLDKRMASAEENKSADEK